MKIKLYSYHSITDSAIPDYLVQLNNNQSVVVNAM